MVQLSFCSCETNVSESADKARLQLCDAHTSQKFLTGSSQTLPPSCPARERGLVPAPQQSRHQMKHHNDFLRISIRGILWPLCHRTKAKSCLTWSAAAAGCVSVQLCNFCGEASLPPICDGHEFLVPVVVLPFHRTNNGA